MTGPGVGGINDPRPGNVTRWGGSGTGGIVDGGAVADERDRAATAIRAIAEKRAALGGLGNPVSDLGPGADGGFGQAFEGGTIHWHPQTGAHEVHGAIHERFLALGGDGGFLGYPTTDETATPDGAGRYNHFQHGSIYWHPETGAHEVHGLIRDKWAVLGWERFGYPSCDEVDTAQQTGRVNHFRRPAADGGDERSIYWTPELGAHSIQGPLRQKWAELGWERGYLGYPISDQQELSIPPFPGGGATAYLHAFERGRLVLRDGGITEYPDTVTFRSGPIVTPEPVGGWLEVTVDSKGLWFFTGNFHSSTALKDYEFVVVAALKAPDQHRGIAYAQFHGHLSGKLGGDDAGWGHGGSHPFTGPDWERVKEAGFTYSWNLTGELNAALKTIVDFAVGAGLFITGLLATSPDTKAKRCQGSPGQPDEVILYRGSDPPPECPPLTQ